MAENSSKNAPRGRFGSFSGVFTPNALTILGLILFMRTGWTVGQVGLYPALLIIILANTISLLTGLSISAIATNMQVKTGGAYYMISRSLGLEIGGAIGIPLYLSQATSVAFYIIGFSEALTRTFPEIPFQLLSVALVLFFGLLAYVGADFVIRIQYVILALIGLALVSLFSGSGQIGFPAASASLSGTGEPFWEVFAVFFPAVTGIMVGVGMSGDLKHPERDIPRGTLGAIVMTALIYMAAAAWLSLHADSHVLRTDPLIMQKIARWPLFILLGVWASTLSSALGSAMAAPRILQALAFDKIVPSFFGRQMGSPTEPRVAVLITTALALTVVFLGQLNFVAKLISMFFLNTYGMINITAGLEKIIQNPSFRPRLRVPGWLSIIGGLACYAAMVLIHPTATLIAVLSSYGIFFLLKRRSLHQRWGDLRTGVWIALARTSLLRLQHLPLEAKNWRPNIVAFTGTPGTSEAREKLMKIAVWLGQGGGIVTLNHLLVGNLTELAGKGYRQTSYRRLQHYLSEQHASAFGNCTIVPEFFQGVTDIAQTHGLTRIAANTVLLGWPRRKEAQEAHLRLMRDLVMLEKSLLFFYDPSSRGFGEHRRIDVWWRGRDRNAQLMLMLAHIIRGNRDWNRASIRILRVLDNEKGRRKAESYITAFLERIRVQAKPVILVEEGISRTRFQRVLMHHSRHTDLVLLGLPRPRSEQIRSHAFALRSLLQALPPTLLVRSAEIEDLLSAEAENGG